MWYMCVFFHRLLDYRKPEVEALAQLFGAFADDNNGDSHSVQWKLPDNFHPDNPFHFVNIPSEDIARDIAKRSELSILFWVFFNLFFFFLQFMILII